MAGDSLADHPHGRPGDSAPVPAGKSHRTALVIVEKPGGVQWIHQALQEHGFATVREMDPQRCLKTCREHPPELVIVERAPESTSLRHFLSELLRISWTTATIVVTELDEDAIHRETEGLGILGSVKPGDVQGLESLLVRFSHLIPSST